MRKISLFLLIFGLFAVGCDSNDNGDDDASDAERLEGSWAMTGVTDAEGDQSESFAENFNSVVVTFNSDDSFSLAVDAAGDGTDLTISGTYSVTETTDGLTLNATVPGVGTIPLAFTYEFVGDDVELTAGAQTIAALNGVLDTALIAPVTFTVSPV